MNFYYLTNIFAVPSFNNEVTTVFKSLEISTEMHFLSLFFLNERNIATSLFIIQLKCTVVHYANLNSSSVNKLYCTRAVEYAISFVFFLFLVYVYFNNAFVKNFIKELLFFNANF